MSIREDPSIPSYQQYQYTPSTATPTPMHSTSNIIANTTNTTNTTTTANHISPTPSLSVPQGRSAFSPDKHGGRRHREKKGEGSRRERGSRGEQGDKVDNDRRRERERKAEMNGAGTVIVPQDTVPSPMPYKAPLHPYVQASYVQAPYVQATQEEYSYVPKEYSEPFQAHASYPPYGAYSAYSQNMHPTSRPPATPTTHYISTHTHEQTQTPTPIPKGPVRHASPSSFYRMAAGADASVLQSLSNAAGEARVFDARLGCF
jgi:hypothetical protein